MTRTALLLTAFSLIVAQGQQPEIDNAWVRVLRVKEGLHEKTPQREWPASVWLYLSDSRERVTGSDGKTRDTAHKAGDVVFEKPAMRTEEILSDHPLEAVAIELKQGPAKSPPVALDPVKLDPEHHIVLLENDRVRVIRTILEPHLKAPMHEHPHYVVVYMTELHTTMAMADGRIIDNVRKAGEIGWRDALKHETENVGDRTAVEIQVELK